MVNILFTVSQTRPKHLVDEKKGNQNGHTNAACDDRDVEKQYIIRTFTKKQKVTR